MKKLIFCSFLFVGLSCSKFIEPIVSPEKPNTQIHQLPLANIKQIIKGEWNLYYTRQMGNPVFTTISNNKITFNNNVDSIKWIDNGTVLSNSVINYQYDTAIGYFVTYKINFIKNSLINNYIATNYDTATKMLTLIDVNTRKMHFLYK